ncbi:MAG: DUF1573 domain-containing protein [Gemmataceae bacterium]
MRSVLFAVCLSLLFARSAAAQTAWADKLFGGVTSHDFGVQPRGSQLKYKFKMTNIYKAPLEITDVRVSCGCLTVTPSTKLLQPGETGWLNCNMDATRFVGPKSIRVYVTVGPEYVSTATLNVSANARGDVVFNPGEIDFGRVARGETPTRHIDVEYAGSSDWRVLEIVKAAGAPFELKVQDIATSPAVRGYRISATLKADAPAGPFRQEVILKTNDPTSPVLTFNILGGVQAALSVTPDRINLAGVKVGDTEKRKIILSASRPFRLIGVDGQGDGVSVILPTSAETTHVIELRFQPTKAGEVRRELLLRTDAESGSARVVIEASAVE